MLAWVASVQRSKVYRAGLKPDATGVRGFRRGVCAYVTEALLPSYTSTCDPSRHCSNLESLAAYANSAGQDVLAEAGYKIGVAQKFLNLLLKYQWCLDLVAELPHCPVDRIVLQKTRFRGKLNWTEIGTIEQYVDVMKEIQDIAERQKLSVAEWELRNYSRR